MFLFVTNFISHQGVMNVHKLGRLRVAFNTSAEYAETSLNDKMLPAIIFLNGTHRENCVLYKNLLKQKLGYF